MLSPPSSSALEHGGQDVVGVISISLSNGYYNIPVFSCINRV